MPTIMIAIQCPVCHYYFDAVTETLARCERCGAVLDLEDVRKSKWWSDREKERARLAGMRDDVLPAGPPDFSKTGGRSSRKKRKKPLRRPGELPGYET